MIQQIELRGQSLGVTNGYVRVGREFLRNLRVEEIPIGITIMYDDDPVESPEAIGVKNVGDGILQALIGYAIYNVDDTLLTNETEYRAMWKLVSSRKLKDGDACIIEQEAPLNSDFFWAGITMQTNSIKDLIASAQTIAERISDPLFLLIDEIDKRIESF